MTVEIIGRLVFDKDTAFNIMFEFDAILRQVEFYKKKLLTLDELLLKIIGKDCFYVKQEGGLILIYQRFFSVDSMSEQTPFIEIDLYGDDEGDGMDDDF